MTIRIGLIGCGTVTQKAHIPAILKDQNFTITALCRRDLSKLGILHEQFPHAKIFSDASELINSGEADCLLVATDAESHLQIAQAALDRDLYVLLEKPVSSSSEDIRKFILKNKAKINHVMVAFNKRFYPGIAKIDELKISGELSKLVGGTMTFLTQQGRRPGMQGVLQNLIHYCDLANWIFGKAVDVHAKFSETLNDSIKGKTIAATILTENGCAVNIFYTSSLNWKIPSHERIQILDDSNNHLYVENTDKAVFSKSNGQNVIFEESNSIFFRQSPFGYESQIAAFANLVKGKAKASPNLNDALEAQVLFEKIFLYDASLSLEERLPS